MQSMIVTHFPIALYRLLMLIHTGVDKSLGRHVAEVSRAVFSNQGSHFTSLLSSPVFKGMSTTQLNNIFSFTLQVSAYF